MPRAAALPTDVETLQELLRAAQGTVDSLSAQLRSRDVLIENLKLRLARLKRMKFGRSSAQLDAQIAQLEFSLEELEANAAAAPAPTQTPADKSASKPTRKPLPDQLRREPHVHEPDSGSCTCPDCGGALRRQSEIYARVGVHLERSTLADWGGAGCALIEPLIDALGDYVLSAYKLHADDTPIRVLAPGPGKCRMGRLWAYVRDDRPAGSTDSPAVWLRYRDDGRIEMDNHAAERELRAVALGRKNHLFAGADAGGDRAATFYSLIKTAKLNGQDRLRQITPSRRLVSLR